MTTPKRRTSFQALALSALALLLTACTQEPGTGGLAAVQGRVYAFDYYDGTEVLKSEYYAPDERVYLIYGDDVVPGDDMRTSYDGTYRFDRLTEGAYTLYVYSECDTCASGLEVKKATFEVTSRKQEVLMPDLIIRK